MEGVLKIQPWSLPDPAAAYVAETEVLFRTKDESAADFVKRIACAYLNAHLDSVGLAAEEARR